MLDLFLYLTNRDRLEARQNLPRREFRGATTSVVKRQVATDRASAEQSGWEMCDVAYGHDGADAVAIAWYRPRTQGMTRGSMASAFGIEWRPVVLEVGAAVALGLVWLVLGLAMLSPALHGSAPLQALPLVAFLSGPLLIALFIVLAKRLRGSGDPPLDSATTATRSPADIVMFVVDLLAASLPLLVAIGFWLLLLLS